MSKTMNARIQHKHGTEAEWALAVNFTPLLGELIIYDVDSTHDAPRVKFGNGTNNVNDLPFVDEIITLDEIDEICGASIISGEEASL